MTLRTLYEYVGSRTSPVTMPLRNRFTSIRCEAPSAPPLGELLRVSEAEGVRLVEWKQVPVLPRAPLKGLAAVAIYGVQMLNAELELAARTG